MIGRVLFVSWLLRVTAIGGWLSHLIAARWHLQPVSLLGLGIPLLLLLFKSFLGSNVPGSLVSFLSCISPLVSLVSSFNFLAHLGKCALMACVLVCVCVWARVFLHVCVFCSNQHIPQKKALSICSRTLHIHLQALVDSCEKHPFFEGLEYQLSPRYLRLACAHKRWRMLLRSLSLTYIYICIYAYSKRQ